MRMVALKQSGIYQDKPDGLVKGKMLKWDYFKWGMTSSKTNQTYL